MVVFPNAKINFGLFVTSKRTDGYHNLETIFIPLKGYCDILEVVINNDTDYDQFVNTGLIIDGKPENNLCHKAIGLLRQKIEIPRLKIHLHKIIPFGAGLGGGSSDAAFILKLLNTQFNGNLISSELEKIASSIGADCAVFIKNEPVFATGIGNQFSPVNLNIDGLWVVIVIPPVNVPTAMAYKNISPKIPSVGLNTLIQEPFDNWKNCICNDFEPFVFNQYPEIKQIKDKLYKKGAIYASMSGSGSSVFGLFYEKPGIDFPSDYKVFTGRL